MSVAIHPQLLLDEVFRRAETMPLDPPVVFTSFERAAAFAELRGWSAGRVTMFRDPDAMEWRIVTAGSPCGCRHADEVRRA